MGPCLHSHHNMSIFAFAQMSVELAEQVADFGLSRHNPNKHTVATKTCGGITHAAPELVREGRLSLATGVACMLIACAAAAQVAQGLQSALHVQCASAAQRVLASAQHPAVLMKLCSCADVFAFGVLLAELLAGEPAWAALKSHAQVIAAVLSGKRPTISASAPSELQVRDAQICCSLQCS
jgi:hypothetical protein